MSWHSSWDIIKKVCDFLYVWTIKTRKVTISWLGPLEASLASSDSLTVCNKLPETIMSLPEVSPLWTVTTVRPGAAVQSTCGQLRSHTVENVERFWEGYLSAPPSGFIPGVEGLGAGRTIQLNQFCHLVETLHCRVFFCCNWGAGIDVENLGCWLVVGGE